MTMVVVGDNDDDDDDDDTDDDDDRDYDGHDDGVESGYADAMIMITKMLAMKIMILR